MPGICSAGWFRVFLVLTLGGENVEDEAVVAFPAVRHRAAHAEEILGTLLLPIRVKTVHPVFALSLGRGLWPCLGSLRPRPRPRRRRSRGGGGGGRGGGA